MCLADTAERQDGSGKSDNGDILMSVENIVCPRNLFLSDFFSFTKKNQIIFSFYFRQQTFVHTITYS